MIIVLIVLMIATAALAAFLSVMLCGTKDYDERKAILVAYISTIIVVTILTFFYLVVLWI